MPAAFTETEHLANNSKEQNDNFLGVRDPAGRVSVYGPNRKRVRSHRKVAFDFIGQD
jgi:hypothetical protein